MASGIKNWSCALPPSFVNQQHAAVKENDDVSIKKRGGTDSMGKGVGEHLKGHPNRKCEDVMN